MNIKTLLNQDIYGDYKVVCRKPREVKVLTRHTLREARELAVKKRADGYAVKISRRLKNSTWEVVDGE